MLVASRPSANPITGLPPRAAAPTTTTTTEPEPTSSAHAITVIPATGSGLLLVSPTLEAAGPACKVVSPAVADGAVPVAGPDVGAGKSTATAEGGAASEPAAVVTAASAAVGAGVTAALA